MREQLVAELDSCLENGRTLPAHWYWDREVLRLERELVFKHSWQLLTAGGSLAEAGDFVTDTIAGTPIVVVRGKDGVLRGFVNVCRHRGHLVASGCGNKSSLQCPYHAWTWSLDGNLRAAPRSEAEPSFDRADYPLLAIQVAEWGDSVFVNLDSECTSFEETYAELKQVGGANGIDLDGMTPRASESWDFACNWKIFYDNSAECYHCPTVHPGFAKGYGVSPADYMLDSREEFVYHRSPVKEHDAGTDDWQMYAVWPNWSVATGGSAEVAFVYSFAPIDPEHTRIVTRVLAAPHVSDEQAAEEMGWWRQIVFDEDRLACESVQRGMRSNAVYDGPLLLDSEHIIQRFQGKLRDAFRGRAAFQEV